MKSTNNDFLTKELREVEKQIDNYYKENPLIKLPFANSAWYFMSFCEDISFKEFYSDRGSIHDAAAFADNFVVHLTYPFLWLRNSCPQGGQVPFKFDERCYKAAWDISVLGENYIPFESAFTLASRGLLELRLEGTNIIPSPDYSPETKYEAYDRLIRRKEPKYSYPSLVDLIEEIESSLKVSGDNFHYQLNPRIVKYASELLTPLTDDIYTLPDTWQFSNYTMGDFRKFSISLSAIALIHLQARLSAAGLGCQKLGYCNSVFVAEEDELLRRLTRYSGVSVNALSCLINDLTYGNRDILKPDPAIQPLIKLNHFQYAIMPSLIISCSMERNFTVLLNKLPSERKIYSNLVSEKEKLMRESIKNGITLPNIRYFNGYIPGLTQIPDIDLAIINDKEKVCIFTELKWLIGPSEVREVIEKSEEIREGINQLLRMSEAITQNPQPFINALTIDSSYKLFYVVVSENTIGMGRIQHPQIPVIQKYHFIKKIIKLGGFQKLIEWLSNRNYLPIEGKHYQVIYEDFVINKWTLTWYGIKIMIDEEFD